jgi:hypothetical protein
MQFNFSESHIVEHRTLGYTVFRAILPPSLLSDLRRAATRIRELTRKETGPRAMRSRALLSYEGNRKPFEDYAQLPPLVDAIQKLLTPSHRHGSGFVLLIEPSDIPVCQAWHRDLRETDPGVEPREFQRVQYDPLFFNQINCPLYEDSCLWYVPGSHLRADVASETRAASSSPFAQRGDDLSAEERERLGLVYCRAMPGACCLAMDAGDCAVYHPLAWHLGNYVPYKIRATLHDTCRTPEVDAWYAARSKR